jgi:hypothetical protein
MKIYQIIKNWTTYADAYSRDQRPESGHYVVKTFKSREKAEAYKEKCEEEPYYGGYHTFEIEEINVTE